MGLDSGAAIATPSPSMTTPSITISGILRQTVVWTFSAIYLSTMVLVCGLTAKSRRTSRGPAWVRGWGWGSARLAGVKIRYTARARAALDERRSRVLTFNHCSTLDTLVGGAFLPDGGVLVLKQEFRRLPFLGLATATIGSVFLDRRDRERAYASLQAAGDRIRDETLQVLIAPEGTRSVDGVVGPFKLGAFHLAYIAKAPILPMVMHGNAELWPPTQLAPTPGTSVVDVLPEIYLDDGDPESLRAAADALREQYRQALAQGPPD